MLPLVSVICNCLNHENFIFEALESVAKQTYTNIELIVINNGSSDDSQKKILEFIKENPQVKFINLEKTLTHNKVFNLAFKQSNGEFLIDLSGDDKLLPDCVEKQISFFKKQNSEVGLVFGNVLEINEKGVFLRNYFDVDENGKVKDKSLFETNYEKLLKGGLCMCSVSAMLSRKYFEILGGYNENLFFEDLDYWLRLSFKYRIAFLDEFLVEKRFLENSFGNQTFKKNKISDKINESLLIIFKEAINRNNKSQNKLLLKRIHNRMEISFKNKDWKYFSKFSLLELKCRAEIYFIKSKNAL